MEYFYIIASLASLLAFIGYIADRFIQDQNRNLSYILIGTFVILTIIFWAWFYFAPSNYVRGIIENRIYEVKSYYPKTNTIGESSVEGKFEAAGHQGTVFLPSFSEPPNIFIKRPDNYDNSWYDREPLRIDKITTDSFRYSYSSSSQSGEWIFRARGTLLKMKKESH